MNIPLLTVIPSVPIWEIDGQLVFDKKFYDGIALYSDLWDGDVSCIMRRTDQNPPPFGLVAKEETDLPFQCRIIGKKETISLDEIPSGSILLASGDSSDQLHFSRECKNKSLKCVYSIEYIPETRKQIVKLSTGNIAKRFRQNLYLRQTEKQRVKAFRISDGIQSNGIPAYNHYKHIKDCIVYFDTRIRRDMIITGDELNTRLTGMRKREKLNLAYTGRLSKIKGTDHLLRLARKLKQQQFPFNLYICGTGELEEWIKAYIKKNHLEDVVFLKGVLDFNRELVPFLKKNIDIFLSLHRQSDPSCTYLETASCGVPIIGYLNKAFSGILEKNDIGWGCPVDDINGIAQILASLFNQREAIEIKSRNSCRFSSYNSFEQVFQSRINHLKKVLKDQ